MSAQPITFRTFSQTRTATPDRTAWEMAGSAKGQNVHYVTIDGHTFRVPESDVLESNR